jgi:hypothetical protein
MEYLRLWGAPAIPTPQDEVAMSQGSGQSSSQPPPLHQDALVEALRPSPDDPVPDVLQLRGFLGRDTDEAHWRLYLSSDLDTYLRIAAADIVAAWQHEADGPTVAPALVVVRSSATIERVEAGPLTTQGDFLRGVYVAEVLRAEESAVSQGRSRRRLPGGDGFPLIHPETGSWVCRPQITIESRTCFCTMTTVQCCER